MTSDLRLLRRREQEEEEEEVLQSQPSELSMLQRASVSAPADDQSENLLIQSTDGDVDTTLQGLDSNASLFSAIGSFGKSVVKGTMQEAERNAFALGVTFLHLTGAADDPNVQQAILDEADRIGTPRIDDAAKAFLEGGEATIRQATLDIGKGYANVVAPSVAKSEGFQQEVQQEKERIERLISFDQDETGMESFARTTGRFSIAVPILAQAGAWAGLGAAGSAFFSGVLSDLYLFSPGEERPSSIIDEALNGEDPNADILTKAVDGFAKALRVDEDDSYPVAKIKQAVEAATLELMAFGAFKGGAAVGRGGKAAAKTSAKAGAQGLKVLKQGADKAGKAVRQGTQETLGKLKRLEDAFLKMNAEKQAKSIGTSSKSLSYNTPTLTRSQAEQAALGRLDARSARIADTFLNDAQKAKLSPGKVDDLSRRFAQEIRKQDVDGVLTNEELILKTNIFKEQAQIRLKPVEPKRASEAVLNALDENDAFLKAAAKDAKAQRSTKSAMERLETFADRQAPLFRRMAGTEAGERAIRDVRLVNSAYTSAEHAYNEMINEVIPIFSPRSLDQTTRQLITLRTLRGITARNRGFDLPLPQLKKTLTKKELKALSAGNLDDNIQALRTRVGEEKFLEATKRADRFFEEQIRTLDLLLRDGVISADQHKKLSRFEFSPIRGVDKGLNPVGELLNTVDPVMTRLIDESGNTVSVRSSGIQELSKGEMDRLLMRPDDFMGQFIIRAHKTARKNRANQSLAKLAKQEGVGFIKAKRPKGAEGRAYVEIDYFEQGKPKRFYMRKDMFDIYNADPYQLGTAKTLMDFVSTFTGVKLAKTGITGALNPFFAATSLARDTVFAFMNAGTGAGKGALYTMNPARLKRFTKDMLDGLDTALFRFEPQNKKIIDEAIDQGLGFEFLAQPSVVPIKRKFDFTEGFAAKGVPTLGSQPKALRALGEIRKASNYLNVGVELGVRLGIRNTFLNDEFAKKGFLTAEDFTNATFAARDVIDFSRRGTVSSLVDDAAMYFNAGVQGAMSGVKAAKTNPRVFAEKVGAFLGISGAVAVGNAVMYPEDWEKIHPQVKARNLVFLTPFTRQDIDGNVRRTYYKIPVDHTLMPFHSFMQGATTQYLKGTPPDETMRHYMNPSLLEGLPESILEGVKTSAQSTVGDLAPGPDANPGLKAWMALAQNKDIWKGQDIDPRKYKPFLPESQFRTESETDEPTSLFSRDIATTVNPALRTLGVSDGVSPARLDVAISAIFPRNIYTELLGAGYEELTSAFTEEERRKMSFILGDSFWSGQNPINKAYVGETSPWAIPNEVNFERMKAQSADLKRSEAVREYYADLFGRQNKGKPLSAKQLKEVESFIETSFDSVHHKSLKRSLASDHKMDKALHEIGLDPGVSFNGVTRTTLHRYTRMHEEVKADFVVDLWAEAELDLLEGTKRKKKEAKKMKAFIKRLISGDVPNWNAKGTEFGRRLDQRLEARGFEINP